MSAGAAGRAAAKPAPLGLMIAGYMVGAEIRRRLDSAAMGAMVRAGTWNAGVEAIRGEVGRAVGSAFSDEAWERGKVEAWQSYADERSGVWPADESGEHDEERAAILEYEAGLSRGDDERDELGGNP